MKIKILFIQICLMMLGTALYAQMKQIDYTDGIQKLHGQLIKPAKAATHKPGILILPAWMGIDEHSKTVAKQLADLGYVAFIADIYGEGNYPKSPKDAGQQSSHYKQNITEYHQRIKLALDQLVKAGANADDIAVIGYCFGLPRQPYRDRRPFVDGATR